MAATQVDIARRVGLEVSSVNKILNKAPGTSFKKSTVAMVFRVARQLGYRLERPTKGWAVSLLKELFPRDLPSDAIARARGVSAEQAREVRKILYGNDCEK